MTDKTRTKTVTLSPTTIFSALEDEEIKGDLEIFMYEDGSILFAGTSILENDQFGILLGKIQKYLRELKVEVGKKDN